MRWFPLSAVLAFVSACSSRAIDGTDDTEGSDASSDVQPVGHNPGGGHTFAFWRDDGLELAFSNVTIISCEDLHVRTQCQDEGVWTAIVTLPSSGEYRGPWGSEARWFFSAQGPRDPTGGCYYGFGDLGDEQQSMVIETADAASVTGVITHLIPDSLEGTAYSGPFEAIVCD